MLLCLCRGVTTYLPEQLYNKKVYILIGLMACCHAAPYINPLQGQSYHSFFRFSLILLNMKNNPCPSWHLDLCSNYRKGTEIGLS